jgi:hypothetical protein
MGTGSRSQATLQVTRHEERLTLTMATSLLA